MTTTAMLMFCACQPAQYGGWETIPGPTMAALSENSEPWLEQLGGGSSTALDVSTANGSVCRWNGTTWRLVSKSKHFSTDLAAADPKLQAIDAYQAWTLGPDDAWVITWNQETLHWDGSTWQPRPEKYIPSWGAAPNDAWAVHEGTVLHWDGTSWRDDHLTGVFAVWGLSSTEVWAVGEFETLRRWDGKSWSALSTAGACNFQHNGCAAFRALWGTSANDLWIVGESGPGFGGSAYGALQHWDGTAFTVHMKYAKQPKAWNETNDIHALRNITGFPTGEVFTTDGERLLRLPPR